VILDPRPRDFGRWLDWELVHAADPLPTLGLPGVYSPETATTDNPLAYMGRCLPWRPAFRTLTNFLERYAPPRSGTRQSPNIDYLSHWATGNWPSACQASTLPSTHSPTKRRTSPDPNSLFGHSSMLSPVLLTAPMSGNA